MSGFNGESIANLISADMMSFQPMATNFIKSRVLSTTGEFNTNEKEADALAELADSVQVTIGTEGDEITFSWDFAENSNYLELMEKGMPAPVAGGDGGIAHNPDGSTYESRVPPSLWGTTLDWLAKEGVDIKSEITMMISDLFRDRVNEAVANNKAAIGELAKAEIMNQITSSMG